MKRCPTEAIRIRRGKAHIKSDRCVGCGECIAICPTRAKVPVYDSFSEIDRFKYKIAIPSPSIYAQFNNLTNINYVLEGILQLGFDEVHEGAVGYEIACQITRKMLKDPAVPKPIISSACPAVKKLLSLRYPDLLANLSRVLEPEYIVAKIARSAAVEMGFLPAEVGIFAISPCVANVYSLREDGIDGVLSFKDIYPSLLSVMNRIQNPRELSKTGRVGITCASIGGEAKGVDVDKYLAADGIENIIRVLNHLEREKLNDLDFVELSACAGGCVGGVLNVENPFLAEARIRGIRMRAPLSMDKELNVSDYMQEEPYKSRNVFKLADTRAEALDKLAKLDAILKTLPGLDCGLCGAPSCNAFAEDYVKGEKMECKMRPKID